MSAEPSPDIESQGNSQPVRATSRCRGAVTNRAFIAWIFPLAASLWVGCSDFGAEPAQQQNPENSTDTMPLVAMTAKPISGGFGTIVSIHGPGIIAGYRYSVRFIGADDILLSDSTRDSTIYTFVPFGARSGPIFLDTYLHAVTQSFTVTESADTTSLDVRRYNLPAPLTARASSLIDYMGIVRQWKADVRGDTVELSQGYSVGEEYKEYHLLLLDRGRDNLPRPIKLWVYVAPDYPSRWADTVHAGLLKIQDWDKQGVMSGTFYGPPSTIRILNGTFTFWVNKGSGS